MPRSSQSKHKFTRRIKFKAIKSHSTVKDEAIILFHKLIIWQKKSLI